MNIGAQQKLYSIINNRIAAKNAMVIENMSLLNVTALIHIKLFEVVLFK